jgi:hypothetical protein
MSNAIIINGNNFGAPRQRSPPAIRRLLSIRFHTVVPPTKQNRGDDNVFQDTVHSNSE